MIRPRKGVAASPYRAVLMGAAACQKSAVRAEVRLLLPVCFQAAELHRSEVGGVIGTAENKDTTVAGQTCSSWHVPLLPHIGQVEPSVGGHYSGS
ncbi:unnamed protein product [Schistocephalus solidus]|uniref:Secreted protein n=1 Tax=Schistocephalus solidus TaxID=70667 RepID=A0A183SAK8_SCHSO|nr:unnamed protein product [Schistocephalus solidus]